MKTISALIIFISLIISCQNENKSSKQNETNSENKNTLTNQPENSYTPKTQTVSGKGDEVKKIELKAGLAIFKSEYNGKSNFIVVLKDNGGDRIEFLVNTIDSYSGSKSVKIVKSGLYLLEITSSGNWKMEIEN